MYSKVQKECLCTPKHLFRSGCSAGGLLRAMEELFLKNSCGSSVQLTLPYSQLHCMPLENIRSLEQRSFSLHPHLHLFYRYRKITSSESLWIGNIRSTFRICGQQFCFPDQSPLIKLARSLFKFSP